MMRLLSVRFHRMPRTARSLLHRWRDSDSDMFHILLLLLRVQLMRLLLRLRLLRVVIHRDILRIISAGLIDLRIQIALKRAHLLDQTWMHRGAEGRVQPRKHLHGRAL